MLMLTDPICRRSMPLDGILLHSRGLTKRASMCEDRSSGLTPLSEDEGMGDEAPAEVTQGGGQTLLLLPDGNVGASMPGGGSRLLPDPGACGVSRQDARAGRPGQQQQQHRGLRSSNSGNFNAQTLELDLGGSGATASRGGPPESGHHPHHQRGSKGSMPRRLLPMGSSSRSQSSQGHYGSDHQSAPLPKLSVPIMPNNTAAAVSPVRMGIPGSQVPTRPSGPASDGAALDGGRGPGLSAGQQGVGGPEYEGGRNSTLSDLTERLSRICGASVSSRVRQGAAAAAVSPVTRRRPDAEVSAEVGPQEDPQVPSLNPDSVVDSVTYYTCFVWKI